MKKVKNLRKKIIRKVFEYIAGAGLISLFFFMFMYGLTISPTIIK